MRDRHEEPQLFLAGLIPDFRVMGNRSWFLLALGEG
ncbi:hypothetical protein HY26_01025 [Hyphomonas sp. GM-8P]|nr:hypothetical protein HY26_01025 [Hyphomonas sp. GM-8P]